MLFKVIGALIIFYAAVCSYSDPKILFGLLFGVLGSFLLSQPK